MRQKKVLLLGSYGQSNLGDDLLMWNYLELLRQRGFDKIYVSANTEEYLPEPIKKAYPDLKIINTYQTSLLGYIRLIREVDCVVYGGGTLYKELYSSTGRTPYSVIVRLMGFNLLARIFGTKLYHLHIGIGSLKTGLGRLITTIALRAATFTTFRDQRSYEFARGTLNLPPKKIRKSTDGLFINPIWQDIWRTAKLDIDRKKYNKVVGINVLSDIPDWVDRNDYIASLRRCIQTLLDDDNYLVFLPFQHAFNPRNDHTFMKDTLKDILKNRTNFVMPDSVPIDLISSYLRQCDVFIGMRFHSLLLACANGVPFVAIAYDTKCWRFIEETQYPYALKLEKLDPGKLIKLFTQAAHAGPDIKKQLQAATRQMYQEAEEDLRTLNL